MRNLIVLMVFAFMSVTTVTAVTLRGRIYDEASKESLIQASVRLLRTDSTAVKAAVTNAEGRYVLEGVKAGKYIVEASYVGYAPQYRDITVGTQDVRMQPFALKESSIMLREATVTGIRTPIKVMEDTVEFSAESYKTAPNAVVEDLLKRLPGVEVGNDGKITANGKEIKKILVDGKEFFSDDPTVASRNLPVDMVEKLQVVDRKSDLARLTGVDDGEEETVINLTVKKDRKNGWFGNAEAGYGTDSRYQGNFNVNRFWNGNQITFLGSANNTNTPAFGMGGMGNFRRFGGSTGITDSRSLGLNFNVGKEEIFRVGGDVMYSYNNEDTRKKSDRTYLFADSTAFENSGSASRDRGHSVRADVKMEWRPDSFNVVEFAPNVSFNFNDSESNDSTMTRAGNVARSLVNEGRNMESSNGKSYDLGGRLIYTHNFASRRGRSFSVMATGKLSNTREDSYSESWNKFYMLNDSVYLARQEQDNTTATNSVGGRITWTEPLKVGSGHFLTAAYRITYRWSSMDRNTYQYPVSYPDGWNGTPVFGDAPVFESELSKQYDNEYVNQDIRLGYRYVSKAANLNVGMSVVPQRSYSHNRLVDSLSYTRSVVNYAPFVRFRYKMSKASSVNVYYSGRSSEPSMTQLMPVEDRSNPMNIIKGNPGLKPTFNHSLMSRFQNFNMEAQRSFMLMLNGGYQQNAIVSNTRFTPETGGRYTTYENVNGVWNLMGMNMISFPFRNKAFTFNNHLFGRYSATAGFNNGNMNRSGSFTVGESFGLAWRPDNLELELRPSYRFQTVKNTLQNVANSNVHSLAGSFYGTYRTPIGLVLNTDLSYSSTYGYADGYDTKTWMWNASMTYEFLSGRNAAVSLKAYDILGQQQSVRRNITANYIDDIRYNTLTRYFMLSFSYKFNTFGKGQQPESRSHGPWGHGPGGPGMPPPRH